MKFLVQSIIVLSSLTTFLIADSVNQKDKENIHSIRQSVVSFGRLDKKKVSAVDGFRYMFSEGQVSGQVRSMFLGYDGEQQSLTDTYATVIGGIIKYELAELNGFNAAAAVYTSNDIRSSITGTGISHNHELSSSKGSYTDMAEAYVNYKYNDFNIRVGRQAIDTPLADTDDIRVIHNTFEASIATYQYKKLEFMLGKLQSWQGYDADLDLGWSPTGENGTYFGGVSYHETLEFQAWYYNITGLIDAMYAEVGFFYKFNEDMSLHGAYQYLLENELQNSGVAANIYGGFIEYTAYGIGLNLSYDHSQRIAGKDTFSGFGGGTLFTSMDTLILNDITADRDVTGSVAKISYNIENFGFLFAIGDFTGGMDGAGNSQHINEQDMNFEYNVNDEFLVSLLYAIQRDSINPDNTLHDWERVQMMVNYNF